MEVNSLTRKRESLVSFRRGLLLCSGAFTCLSMLVLSQGPESNCPHSSLRLALWLSFSVHATLFLLLLLHFIYMSFLLKRLAPFLPIFSLYSVGAMLSV
jgi:hypothetical protein